MTENNRQRTSKRKKSIQAIDSNAVGSADGCNGYDRRLSVDGERRRCRHLHRVQLLYF